MNPDVDDRLRTLETHVAHLERLHDELNTVITEQARELARMQTQLRSIAQTVEQEETSRVLAHPQRPPHSSRP